jgi:predicted nuclease of predicted toxin-antitoxin system
MALRFSADHCVSNYIMQSLREAGHQVLRLTDYLPAESPDQGVISRARDLSALLLSLDGDFADIVAYPPRRFKGIVALQVLDHPEVVPILMSRLKAYLSTYPSTEHYIGKLIVVEAHRIRVRE